MTTLYIDEKTFASKGHQMVLKEGKKQILVMKLGEKIFALDNRCPHEGYPLAEGSLEVYAGLSCIARHRLVQGRHQTVVEPAHFEALWKALGQPDQNDRLIVPGPRIGQKITEPQVEVRALAVYQALADGEVL